jgi:hypothetical protein
MQFILNKVSNENINTILSVYLEYKIIFMKKRQIKKLTINRTTLTNLENKSIKKLKGGGSTILNCTINNSRVANCLNVLVGGHQTEGNTACASFQTWCPPC